MTRFLGLSCFLWLTLWLTVCCGSGGIKPQAAGLKVEPRAQLDFAAYCSQTSKLSSGALFTRNQLLARLGTSDCGAAALKIKSLHKLDLHATDTVDLTPLAFATSLRELSLSYTRVDDLRPLLELESLAVVNLDGLAVQNEDLALLAQLPALRELSLIRTGITDLAPLRDKESLESLRLGEAQVDLAALESLNLRQLYLYHMTNIDLSHIGRLTSLQSLTIEQTPLADEQSSELAKLKNLKELNLTGSHIGSLAFVAGLPKLAKLYLSDTRVADLSPLRHSRKLQVLALGRTEVSDLTPLGELYDLTHLYLYQTRVSKLDSLRGLKNLRHLSLSQTEVRSVADLTALQNLESLFLLQTFIRDKTPLLTLRKLKVLHIEDNGFDDEFFTRLKTTYPEMTIITHPVMAGLR